MCANWAADSRDLSPDRNNRYRLDNVGLQLGLGVPLQLLYGVSLVNRPRENGGRGRVRSRRSQNCQNRGGKVEVQQTVDGIPIRKLYITNISIEAQRQEMYEIFGFYGPIVNVYLGISRNDNSKQFAFITFMNPLDAARVLMQQRFQDRRGRTMYVNAADSWHQPREGPDGSIEWNVSRKTSTKQEEACEEDEEQSAEGTTIHVETEINEGSLNILNDDCLMHIFSFLSYKELTAIERVCKRWQALSYRMWRCLHELNFSSDGPFANMPRNTRVLDQYLRRCGESLTTLDLTTNNQTFNETTLAVIAIHCSNLEVLRVSDIHVANRSLAHLGRACPRLKQLVMADLRKVSDNDLNSLLPKCPDLSVLELSHIDNVTGKCLANIKGPVTDLRLLGLSNINPHHLVSGLMKMSPTLVNLTLSACSNIRSSGDIGRIVSAVPNLTSLSLCCCMLQFDNNSLSTVGHLSKLTSLNLHLNNSVNDSVLSAIVEGCEELVTLNLSGSGGGCAGILSERGLSMLSRLRKLINLDLSYLEATNNLALKNITARNCRLKRLLCRGCPELSDEGTELVVTLCNDLELFDLSGCHNVTERTVETAITSVKIRTNNIPLRVIVGGTKVPVTVPHNKDVPLLTVDFADLSEDHLRPDFIDDMFFPPSDSDDDEDLDHLCCDCDFDFDDLFDPTLINDETRKFGLYSGDLDFEEFEGWIDGNIVGEEDDDEID